MTIKSYSYKSSYSYSSYSY